MRIKNNMRRLKINYVYPFCKLLGFNRDIKSILWFENCEVEMDELNVILPCLLEDETIMSFITRATFLSGIGWIMDLWRLFCGSLSFPPLAYPTGLDRLGLALGMNGGEVLVQKHTGLPAYRLFSNKRIYANSVLKMRDQSSLRQGIATAFSKDGNRYAARYCKLCAIDDFRKFGTSYFRRFHCLPGVLACDVHECSLTAGCGRCAWTSGKSHRSWLPSIDCVCGGLTVPCLPRRTNIEPYIRIAKMIRSFILVSDFDVITREIVGEAYKSKLLSLGIENGECLRKYVCGAYRDSVLTRLNIGLDGGWLEQIVKCGTVPIGLAKNAIIMNLLFGSYKKLQNYAKNIDVGMSGEKLTSCKESILMDIKNHTNDGLREIRRRLPDEYAYVENFDRAWLEEHLRHIYHGSDSVHYFSRRAEIDIKLLSHVKNKHASLCDETRRPVKITKRKLLDGFPAYSMISKNLNLYPRSAAFVNKVSETPERYMCRLARYLWTYGNPGTSTMSVYIKLLTGLSAPVAARLARGSLPRNGEEPPQVRQLMRDRRRQNAGKRRISAS
ncbi:TnsD family Tn7-like transposition protein [Paraburkholderia phytofirmans]|uniref:TnsD family Tn7-like transposition protein n=1 Tax=Paraburkholderia phytofirmans TaxID=261302 RepID=UPI0011DF9DFE|nr:TnsD family Tn7-like transposition protein [Paraburkholderia phytofirmans]